MKPGREVDALVAEKVMGWTISEGFYYGPGERVPANIPRYSTDIAAAWEVVEKMRGAAGFMLVNFAGGGWQADIGDACEHAETAAHAICLAALTGVGYWSDGEYDDG